MEDTAQLEALRACSECAQIKPLTSFRRRYRGRPDRMHMCNSCHAARERLRRRKRRYQQDQLSIQKFATAYCSTRDHERRRLIAAMGLQAVGGLEPFLKKWVAAIEDLTTRRQSSPRLLRLFELLWELQREQDFRRRVALKNASDEDLIALIDGQMADWIKRDPEMVLLAASKLGWSLIPPKGAKPWSNAAIAG